MYWEGEKERYYVKRFLIEQPEKEDLIITDHPNSQLEVVSTDYIPRIEIEYKKARGKERKENETVNIEEFIAVKGIKAQGNQLTSENVKQIDVIEPLPYEEEVKDDEESKSEEDKPTSQQSSLFD